MSASSPVPPQSKTPGVVGSVAAIPPGVYHASATNPTQGPMKSIGGVVSTPGRALLPGSTQTKGNTSPPAPNPPLAPEAPARHADIPRLQESSAAAVQTPGTNGCGGSAQDCEVELRYAMRTVAAERMLKRLQRENDLLKHREIDGQRRTQELQVRCSHLQEELEAMGRTVVKQTVTLKSLTLEMQRRPPHRLAKDRREDLRQRESLVAELEKVKCERSELERQYAAQGEALAALEAQIQQLRGSSKEDIELEVDAVNEDKPGKDLVRMITALEALVSQLESPLRGPTPSVESEETVYSVHLSVLSCSNLRFQTSTLGGRTPPMNPSVVVRGPFGNVLVQTATKFHTSDPYFTDVDRNTCNFRVIRCGAWHVLLEVLSCAGDDNQGQISLGSVQVPVVALLSQCSHGDPRLPVDRVPTTLHTMLLETGSCGTISGSICFEVRVEENGLSPSRTCPSAAGQYAPPLSCNTTEAAAASHLCPRVPFAQGSATSQHEHKLFTYDPLQVLLSVLHADRLLKRSSTVPSSPYVVVYDVCPGPSSVCQLHELFRTGVVESNSANPAWNAGNIVVSLKDRQGDILFRVFDRTVQSGYDDEFLGEARLAKSTVFFTEGNPTRSAPTLQLQPRAEEPLQYIRLFRDQLGTLTVRCVAPNSPIGRARCVSTPLHSQIATDTPTAEIFSSRANVPEATVLKFNDEAACPATVRSGKAPTGTCGASTSITPSSENVCTESARPPGPQSTSSGSPRTNDTEEVVMTNSSGAVPTFTTGETFTDANEVVPVEVRESGRSLVPAIGSGTLGSTCSSSGKASDVTNSISGGVALSHPASVVPDALYTLVPRLVTSLDPRQEAPFSMRSSTSEGNAKMTSAVVNPLPALPSASPLSQTMERSLLPSTETLPSARKTQDTAHGVGMVSVPLSSIDSSPQPEPADPTQRLRIYVKEGKNLMENGKDMLDVLGICDPRVVIWIGEKLVHTVPEVHSALNPLWKEEQGTVTWDVRPDQIIRFNVQDVNPSGIDTMGTAAISVRQVLSDPGEHRLPVMLAGQQYGSLIVIFSLP